MITLYMPLIKNWNKITHILHFDFEKVAKWSYENVNVILCILEETLKTKHLFLKVK